MSKKLIEVGLPLDLINDASAYDKMPGIGAHPKGLHHWWARLPLPTARAILYASLVDDPSSDPKFSGQSEVIQNAERERRFETLRGLLQKRANEAPDVFLQAHEDIVSACDGKVPPVLDPFSGGGSIPLEAQRLGLQAIACDLNPIAALINKAALEIIPRWLDKAPINPEASNDNFIDRKWEGAHGLAADVRCYARKILDRARHKLEAHYPLGPGNKKAVAWIWCRTVASPNPACKGAHVPIMRSFRLAKKKNEVVWLEPVISKSKKTWEFKLGQKKPEIVSTIGRRGGVCIISNAPISLDYIREEGKAGRLGVRLVAVVSDGRQYFHPNDWSERKIAPKVDSIASEAMPHNPFSVRPPLYGLNKFSDCFLDSQIYSLSILVGLVNDARKEIEQDARKKMSESDAGAYADSICTFLGFAVDRCVDFNNSLCRWSSTNQKVMNTFGRQAIPMIWDFAEANIMGDSVGSWSACSEYIADCVEAVPVFGKQSGRVFRADAAELPNEIGKVLVSTDPPYYNNIDYSDLSDFFYVWTRKSLGAIYPDFFATMLTPKTPELVASPYRFDGNKLKAKEHFENGFKKVFSSLLPKLDERFPMTVYYAFKQTDEEEDDGEDEEQNANSVTTGWETLLEALIGSGFQITGTWPVRASQKWRQMSMGMNALASYIILSCRPRPKSAKTCTRRAFLAELKSELPDALKRLQQNNIAPVDLAQAAIGPAMAVYSKYSAVLESDDSPMRVRTALVLINQVLDETLSASDSILDQESRWAIAWFEQNSFEEGSFGDANILAQAKNVAINTLDAENVVAAKAGKVRLVTRDSLEDDWFPKANERVVHWKAMQHLIQRLLEHGEVEAGILLRSLGSNGDICRDLAYRCFSISEKRQWSQEALAYNSLVTSWNEIVKQSRDRSNFTQESFKLK